MTQSTTDISGQNLGRLEEEDELICKIESLEPGELAALRRACGEPDPSRGRCPWFYHYLEQFKPAPAGFLVATLLAQYSTVAIKQKAHRGKGDFGTTWKKAVAHTESKSIRRRINILLDAAYNPWTGEGDLPYRLRQMVRYAKAKDQGVDWSQLLKDLRYWNSATKQTQKNWAKSFYVGESDKRHTTTDTKNDHAS